MLRLSKLTDYAVVILARMAGQSGRANAAALAQATGLPEPTVAKILKDLTRSGLVQSARGATGGYVLAMPEQAITIRAVIEAIDGPIAIADCVEGAESKCVSACCQLRGNWNKVNEAITGALDALTLTDMMRPTPASPQIYQIAAMAK